MQKRMAFPTKGFNRLGGVGGHSEDQVAQQLELIWPEQ